MILALDGRPTAGHEYPLQPDRAEMIRRTRSTVRYELGQAAEASARLDDDEARAWLRQAESTIRVLNTLVRQHAHVHNLTR